MDSEEIINRFANGEGEEDECVGYSIGVPSDPKTWHNARVGDVYQNIIMRKEDEPIIPIFFLLGYSEEEIPERLHKYAEYLEKFPESKAKENAQEDLECLKEKYEVK